MPEIELTVRPMNVGAEILGLVDPEDPAVRSALYQAWMEYGILLFKNVNSVDQHFALSRCFGELEMHPLEKVRAKEHPYFMPVGNEIQSFYVYDEVEIKTGTVPWHRDTAYTPRIAKGAMLRMLETPPTGGETLFCDTARAYDELPDSVKERLDGLEYKATLKRAPMDQPRAGAIWTTVRPLTEQEHARYGIEKRDRSGAPGLPPVVHPAVAVHPDSGRTCLFLSPKEFDFFLGMEKSESDELFEYLVGHLLQDRYVYKHRWEVNDAMVWDNRRFMHAAVGNRLGDSRRGLRTTLAGDLEIGRVYEAESVGGR